MPGTPTVVGAISMPFHGLHPRCGGYEPSRANRRWPQGKQREAKPRATLKVKSNGQNRSTEKPVCRTPPYRGLQPLPAGSRELFVAGQGLGRRHLGQDSIDIDHSAAGGTIFQPAQPFQSRKFLTHSAGHQLVDGNALFPSQPFGVGAKIIG